MKPQYTVYTDRHETLATTSRAEVAAMVVVHFKHGYVVLQRSGAEVVYVRDDSLSTDVVGRIINRVSNDYVWSKQSQRWLRREK